MSDTAVAHAPPSQPTADDLAVDALLDDRVGLERELCTRSFRDFFLYAWDQVEQPRGSPARSTLRSSWHLDATCDHLQAVADFEITRLAINFPPRMTKSLCTSVAWPAWVWTREAESRLFTTSYAQRLATRDAVKARALIESPWYRERWPHVQLAPDQNEKARYLNTRGGERYAASVGGSVTGEGGDHITADDPHNVVGSLSAADREATTFWWNEAMQTRLNDPDRGTITLIMQRLHEEDLTGDQLVRDDSRWEHLMLPMEYEPRVHIEVPEEWDRVACPIEREHKCSQRTGTSIGFRDPRLEAEELGDPAARLGFPMPDHIEQERRLLAPWRFSDRAIAPLKAALGNFGAAGQLQQRPVPRGGGQFDADEFVVVPRIPAGAKVVKTVRGWDKAGTDDAGDYTAGVLMAELDDGRAIVLDVVRVQKSTDGREQAILGTARQDGVGVPIWIEQEPGSGGKDSARMTVRKLRGFNARVERVTGSKPTRAEPYSAQVNQGNVLVVNADWTKPFIAEHRAFPRSVNDDQVDAASLCFNKLFGGLGVTWGDLYQVDDS